MRVKMAGLRPHPRQGHHVDDLSEARLSELAEQTRKRGLDRPIEILPDGTVICGRQRYRAAILLGRQVIETVVRYDLAAKGHAALEERLIRDNPDRRRLDPLEVARCYRGLKQLMSGSWQGRLSGDDKKQLRDVIGYQPGYWNMPRKPRPRTSATRADARMKPSAGRARRDPTGNRRRMH